MRVQHWQKSHSSRHKLAALLALIVPSLAAAQESKNLLRLEPAPTAATPQASSGPVGDRIIAVDHTDLVAMPDDLAEQAINDARLQRGAAASTQQTMLVLDGHDGWVPRGGRPQSVSPLVVDPMAERRLPLVPLLGQPFGKGPLVFQPDPGVSPLVGPVLIGPWNYRGDDQAGVSKGAIGPDSNAANSAIKLGNSASSTLKLVPNVLTPVPRTVELHPEVAAESTVENDSSGPKGRIAMTEKRISAPVDNPEQNEPADKLTSDELAAADAIDRGESEGMVPEVSGAELAFEGDGVPLEPLDSVELLVDQPVDGVNVSDINGGEIPDTSAKNSDNATTDASASVGNGGDAGPAPMEIRKLRLRDDFQDTASPGAVKRSQQSPSLDASSDPIALEPLDPSIAKMRVGDVEPRPLSEYEAPRSSDLVQPLPRSVGSASNNPIQGDTITSAGELVLVSGRDGVKLAVKPQTARLKPMIERALKYYWDRPEDAAERTHWGMMHSIMVFDRDTQIISRRQRFNAVAWMAGNNPCRDQILFTRDQHGILPKTGVGLQGHQAQLLAIFGLIDVPLNYPVYASKQKFTVNDILLREMRDCKVKTELTFTLIGLAHYADSDTTWVSGDGQDWSVPRLIQEELGQPIVGAACGGTHRLMGFGHAVRRRHAEGKPINGQWERADRYVKDFAKYTWSLQNRDGSMSTAWYEKPEDNGDIDRKIQTTGHMLEMLMTVTPDSDLQSPEMLRTVNFMATTLFTERGHEWQIGPKGHALRSLVMYYQRVYGNATPWRPGNGSRSAGTANVRTVR